MATEKQLEALARGRKKSLENQKARARLMQQNSVKKRLSNKQGREAALAVLRLPASSIEAEGFACIAGKDVALTQENLADLAMLVASKEGNQAAYTALMKKAGLLVEKVDATVSNEWTEGIKTKEEAKRFLQKMNKA